MVGDRALTELSEYDIKPDYAFFGSDEDDIPKIWDDTTENSFRIGTVQSSNLKMFSSIDDFSCHLISDTITADQIHCFCLTYFASEHFDIN